MIYTDSLFIHTGISRDLRTDLLHQISRLVSLFSIQEFVEFRYIRLQRLRNNTVSLLTHNHGIPGKWEAAGFTDMVFADIENQAG